MLSTTQLSKMTTARLFSYMDRIRSIRSSISCNYGPRCCDICHEYIGEDWENDVSIHLKPFDLHLFEIRTVLKNHPRFFKANNKKFSEHTSKKIIFSK